jgi:hypothetical protein
MRAPAYPLLDVVLIFRAPALGIGDAFLAVTFPPGATFLPMFFLPAFLGRASTLPLCWRQRLFAHWTLPRAGCGVILMADGNPGKHAAPAGCG